MELYRHCLHAISISGSGIEAKHVDSIWRNITMLNKLRLFCTILLYGVTIDIEINSYVCFIVFRIKFDIKAFYAGATDGIYSHVRYNANFLFIWAMDIY